MILDKHYQSLQEELQLRKLNACLKNCIWSHVQRLSLKTSMRLRITGDLEAGRFAALLFGNGTITMGQNEDILLPNVQPFGSKISSFSVSIIQDLIKHVYPNIKHHFKDSNWLCERAILAPNNQTVDSINWKLLQEIPKESMKYFSLTLVEQE